MPASPPASAATTSPTTAAEAANLEAGSFRDPAGFVYRRDGRLYRQINPVHAEDWQAFLDSGLYARLVERGWLVEHADAPAEAAFDERAWRVLEPRQLSFISYPYEWTFGQLKDAALLTLDVLRESLAGGMILRDASAYNVQFDRGRPTMIDALSFERYQPDTPWIAYRQFCQHFLAPLALMALRDVRTGLMLRDFIDGIPLDLATRLLPMSSRLRLGLGTHLHLHARAQSRGSAADVPATAGNGRQPSMSRSRLDALVESLRSTVEGLRWEPAGTVWADYATTTSYSDAGAASKATLVGKMLARTDGDTVWDLGANTGSFSRLAAEAGRNVIALDADPAAAELHYRQLRANRDERILPLVMDLANPSPALGWASAERRSLVERADADVLLALAVIHHLAIGNNVPLPAVSAFMASLGRQLIIEFVPKSDPRVAGMLAHRRDIFDNYSLDGFKAAFATDWETVDEQKVADSERTLFLLRRR